MERSKVDLSLTSGIAAALGVLRVRQNPVCSPSEDEDGRMRAEWLEVEAPQGRCIRELFGDSRYLASQARTPASAHDAHPRSTYELKNEVKKVFVQSIARNTSVMKL